MDIRSSRRYEEVATTHSRIFVFCLNDRNAYEIFFIMLYRIAIFFVMNIVLVDITYLSC